MANSFTRRANLIVEEEYACLINIWMELLEAGRNWIQEVSEADNLYSLVTDGMIMCNPEKLLFEFLSLALTYSIRIGFCI